MAILEPELAILDETDSGLDIDALRTVAKGIREIRADRPQMGVVLITHYQRLLDEVTPDHVHILVDGRIVASGGMELAAQLERDGYEAFRMSLDSLDRDAACRKQFPMLQRRDRRPRRSSTSTRPTRRRSRSAVIDAMTHFTETSYAPINRSAYRSPPRPPTRSRAPGQGASGSSTRRDADEVIFTKNATEALNLVAYSLGPGQPAATATSSC